MTENHLYIELRVPVAIEQHDGVNARQVGPKATGPDRHEEQLDGARGLLERLDRLVPRAGTRRCIDTVNGRSSEDGSGETLDEVEQLLGKDNGRTRI